MAESQKIFTARRLAVMEPDKAYLTLEQLPPQERVAVLQEMKDNPEEFREFEHKMASRQFVAGLNRGVAADRPTN